MAALTGDGEGAGSDGVTAALAGAARALESVRGVDAALDGLSDRVAALAVEADDLATELRAYGEGVEATPGRLEEVEERLALLDRLKRKHGGTLAAVLAHAEECRRRRDELVGAEEALEGAQAALGEARAELEERAAALRTAREAAAGALADAVRERLAALAMDGATFEAALSDRDGYGPSGGDEVEFLIAPNPGRARRAAARDRLGRRALARDAGADGRRRRGGRADAGLRRGRRRHRRADRAGRRRAAARARRGPPGDLHHAPAADRQPGRPALHDRQGRRRARRRARPSPSSSAATSSASWSGCSAPTATTPRRAATPASC